MAVLINFKICDNAKECGGIAVCPTKALTWDDNRETIVIDNDKCKSCGLCEKNCPIGAFNVAKTKEEYERIKNEIDEDPRTIKDLFVDRYGAAPLSDFFMLKSLEIEEKIKHKGITLIELYKDDSIECLIKSIPIKELTEDFKEDTLFYKVEADDEAASKYSVEKFPSLLVFRDNKYLGHIDGYYTTDEKNLLLDKLKKLL